MNKNKRKGWPIWERFLDLALPEPNSGCWLWTGRVDKDGYGSFQVNKEIGKVRAHRFAYEYIRGPIPPGLVINHLCEVAGCVNPDHLEAITQQANIDYCRSHVGKRTHCPKGHAYAGDNLVIDCTGRRVCRTCRNSNARRYRETRRVAA